MGIESGPSGGFERPRTEYTTIEGKVESSFTEIDIDQAFHIPLPPTITWPTARLSFEQVGTYNMPERFGMSSHIPVYAGQMEYVGKKGKIRKANLSLTTSKDKPVLFTGTRNGFYAHDPLMAGREHPFYVVGLQPDELIENMSRMSAIYHELGHVAIFHEDLDTQLLQAAVTLQGRDLPPVALARTYGSELADALPRGIREEQSPFEATRQALTRLEARNYKVAKVVHLFHERNAWAVGMNMVRAKGYPTGFEKDSSYFDYARLCLDSYARYYGDRRFVQGMRKS